MSAPRQITLSDYELLLQLEEGRSQAEIAAPFGCTGEANGWRLKQLRENLPAPTARQAESLLWAKVNHLWRKAKGSLPGRCLLTKLEASLDQTALGSTTNEPEKFAGWHCEHLSRRDEAYVALRDRLRDGDNRFAATWSPLSGQLCALMYGFTSRGQLKVESKGEMRRRGVESPDGADAVALAFTPTQAGFCTLLPTPAITTPAPSARTPSAAPPTRDKRGRGADGGRCQA